MDYNQIIFVLSSIGAEALKDVAKYFGKRTYELVSSLRESIAKVGIDDFRNIQEVREKLDTRPDIKAEIGARILNNEAEFIALLQYLGHGPILASGWFHSEKNRNVINIDTNHGTVTCN